MQKCLFTTAITCNFDDPIAAIAAVVTVTACCAHCAHISLVSLSFFKLGDAIVTVQLHGQRGDCIEPARAGVELIY